MGRNAIYVTCNGYNSRKIYSVRRYLYIKCNSVQRKRFPAACSRMLNNEPVDESWCSQVNL